MLDHDSKTTYRYQSSWLDFLAMGIVASAAIESFWGAMVTYFAQAQIPEAPLWPLPGLVLVDWVSLALLGFITSYLCFRQLSAKWLYITWLVTGSFIPLSILGAFSIGSAVFIAFVLFVVSTIFFTIRQSGKLLQSFGFLMLGSIGNLVVLVNLIAFGTKN
jgi:hypothetical protein